MLPKSRASSTHESRKIVAPLPSYKARISRGCIPLAKPSAIIPPVDVPANKSTCAKKSGNSRMMRSSITNVNTPSMPPPSNDKIRYRRILTPYPAVRCTVKPVPVYDNRRQLRPDAPMNSCEASGPQLPPTYSCTGDPNNSQPCKIGFINAHDVSTSSLRVNKVESPIMASSNNRS